MAREYGPDEELDLEEDDDGTPRSERIYDGPTAELSGEMQAIETAVQKELEE